MRRSTDFTAVVRAGDRARSERLVVHQRHDAGVTVPLLGLVVGRSVGNSVVRHRVSRRLRAQLAVRLDRLPSASATVIRALPAAAAASSQQLADDLDRALHRIDARRAVARRAEIAQCAPAGAPR